MKKQTNWKISLYPNTGRKGYIKVIARNIKNPDLVINVEVSAENARDFDPDVYWATGLVK